MLEYNMVKVIQAGGLEPSIDYPYTAEGKVIFFSS
jgi:hypothetical protein